MSLVERLEKVIRFLDGCLPPSEAEEQYAAELNVMEQKLARAKMSCRDVERRWEQLELYKKRRPLPQRRKAAAGVTVDFHQFADEISRK